MELSSQISSQRLEHGVSQDDLAEVIFVSRQTVSNWENDKTYPDVQSLELLSQLFGITIDELVQGDVARMRRAMEEDSKRMKQLSLASAVLLVLSVAFFVMLVTTWPDALPFTGLAEGNVDGIVVFIPLYSLSMWLAFKIERIKYNYDLLTYREIVAFMNGNGSDVERVGRGFERTHPLLTRVVKFLFAAIAGAVVGLVIYKLFS